MGIKPKDTRAKTFDVRLNIRGNNADIIRNFIEIKMANENRKKITDTVEAVLLEAAKKQKQ